jgi:hypothetical protein
MSRSWRTFIGSLIIAGAAVTVAPTSPEPAVAYQPVEQVDCGQSWPYAHRVCYDIGTGWFHIYTTWPYQQPNLSFPSNTGHSGIGKYSGYAGIFNVTDNTCNDEARWDGGAHIRVTRKLGACNNQPAAVIVYGAVYDGPSQIGMYGGNWNYLVWYLSVAGYDLVITVG